MGLVDDLIAWRDTFARFWLVWARLRQMIFDLLPVDVPQEFQEILLVSWIYAGFFTRVLSITPNARQEEAEAPKLGLYEIGAVFLILWVIIAFVGEMTLGRSLRGAGDTSASLYPSYALFGTQGVFFLVMGCLVFAVFTVADEVTKSVAVRSLGWTLVGVAIMFAVGAKFGPAG